MAQFKVRDLMINVLPEEGVGRWGCGITFCAPPTMVGCDGPSFCNPLSIACRGISFCPNITRCIGVTLIGGCDAGPCSLVPCTDGCSRCTVNATPCHTPTVGLIGVEQPGDLVALKAQLRQALAQVEAQEQALEESMRPQTLEEATALEEKLEEALEEVRERKEELQEGAED